MSATPSIREVECRALRAAWWALPLLLAVLFPLAKGYAWPLISLYPGLPPSLGPRGIVVFAAAGLGLGLGLAALWAWSLRERGTYCDSWRWAILIALLVAILADAVARHPVVLDALWSAVRARAQADEDFFIRETALFRRMALTNSRTTEKPRLQVFGSSQLIMGVDYDLLQDLRPDLQVERRSVAAMCPARMLMAAPYLGSRTGDTIVVYWSEFDMGGATSLDVVWYRAFANWPGLRAVLDLLPDGEWRKNFRRSVELFWGCASELWRDRDGWRLLASRVVGEMRRASTGTEREGVLSGQSEGYVAGLNNEPYFQMGLQAARLLVQQWRATGAEVVVLEGDVNPAIRHPRTPERRLQTRLFLEELCQSSGARYISSATQSFVPSAQNWKDGTHFKAEARVAFTRYLATLLPVSASEAP